MNVELCDAIGHDEEISALFTEYTDMLVKNDNSFREYLSIQKYDDEVIHPEHKYARPEGRLYLMYCDGELAGCVGLRKLDDDNCELKRLYVREEYRGKGLGKFLTEKIISDAKEIGYSHLLLDTLPFLTTALKMYAEMGFYEIPCYNDSPMDTTIFLKFDL